MYGGGYNHPPQSGPPTSQGIPANTYRRRRLSNLGENHNSAGFQNRSLGRPTSNADTQSGHQVPVESIFPPNTSLMPPSTEPMPHPSFGERGHYSTSQATPRTSPPAPVAVRDDHAASMQQAGYSMSSSNTVYSTYNQTRNMTVPTNGVLDNLVPTLDQPYYRSYGGMVDSNVEVEPGHSPSRTPSSYSPSVMQSSTLLPPSGPSNNSLGNTRFSNGLVMPTTAGSGPYVQQLQTQYLGQRQLYPSNPNNDNGYLSHTSRGPLTSDSNMSRCQHCGNQYHGKNSQRSLSRHIETKHSPSSSQTSTDNGEVYKCEACDREYHRKDARLKHERDRHPELNRPPKVPRPKTATVSQGGSPASTTHHDSGEGWRRSPSANALQNTNDSYSPDFMYHQ